MKPIFWDSVDPATGQPYTWDSANPNITWDGILEPGDPGYTPYPPVTAPVNQPPAKSKKMKRQAYYPTSAAEQLVWLENFRNKLPGYQAAIPLTITQSDAGVADARSVMYVIGSWLPAARAWNKSCTDAAAQAQSGVGAIALPVFTAPALPAGVVLGNNGALDRLFALIQIIKDSPGYTEAIGLDLGIVGSTHTAPDFALVQPTITAIVNGLAVDIGWGWDGNSAFLDQCEIQVDRGSGWTLLTIDTTPGYTDTAAHPATLTKWKYRAIYRVSDHQVGLWSNEVSVTVGG